MNMDGWLENVESWGPSGWHMSPPIQPLWVLCLKLMLLQGNRAAVLDALSPLDAAASSSDPNAVAGGEVCSSAWPQGGVGEEERRRPGCEAVMGTGKPFQSLEVMWPGGCCCHQSCTHASVSTCSLRRPLSLCPLSKLAPAKGLLFLFTACRSTMFCADTARAASLSPCTL